MVVINPSSKVFWVKSEVHQIGIVLRDMLNPVGAIAFVLSLAFQLDVDKW